MNNVMVKFLHSPDISNYCYMAGACSRHNPHSKNWYVELYVIWNKILHQCTCIYLLLLFWERVFSAAPHWNNKQTPVCPNVFPIAHWSTIFSTCQMPNVSQPLEHSLSLAWTCYVRGYTMQFLFFMIIIIVIMVIIFCKQSQVNFVSSCYSAF